MGSVIDTYNITICYSKEFGEFFGQLFCLLQFLPFIFIFTCHLYIWMSDDLILNVLLFVIRMISFILSFVYFLIIRDDILTGSTKYVGNCYKYSIIGTLLHDISIDTTSTAFIPLLLLPSIPCIEVGILNAFYVGYHILYTQPYYIIKIIFTITSIISIFSLSFCGLLSIYDVIIQFIVGVIIGIILLWSLSKTTIITRIKVFISNNKFLSFVVGSTLYTYDTVIKINTTTPFDKMSGTPTPNNIDFTEISKNKIP